MQDDAPRDDLTSALEKTTATSSVVEVVEDQNGDPHGKEPHGKEPHDKEPLEQRPALQEATRASPLGEQHAATPPLHTCWICYGTVEEHDLLSPCKCKGTLQYAHKTCLLEWLGESQTTRCPHCNYEYNIETTYSSWFEEWLDHPYVPYVLSALAIALLFYLFHQVFTRLMKGLRKRLSASQHSASSMFNRPETMGLIRTALPTFHPAFSLFMGGFQANVHRTAQWSVTLLFAEFEIFAFVIAALFCVSKYAYTYFTNRYRSGASSESANTNADPSTVASDPAETDVHEGFAEVSLLHEDQPATPPPTPTDGVLDGQTDPPATVWDVANQFWLATNVGSRTSVSEEAVYLFPFDVAQTAFYTLHYYLKQHQQIFINKKVIIAPAQSQSLSNTSGI